MDVNRDRESLFSVLESLAVRQEENFFTEAFAYLLRFLCSREPATVVRLLSRLTDNHLDVPVEVAGKIEIETQVSVKGGRPDMRIVVCAHIVYLEVKVESSLGEKQLNPYRDALNDGGYDKKTLVLLTKYAPRFKDGDEMPDASVRWYRVADWLELEVCKCADPVAKFLICQFVDFLRAKRVTMNKVDNGILHGVGPIVALMDMLQEAVAKAVTRKKLKKCTPWFDNGSAAADSGFIGLYLDGQKV